MGNRIGKTEKPKSFIVNSNQLNLPNYIVIRILGHVDDLRLILTCKYWFLLIPESIGFMRENQTLLQRFIVNYENHLRLLAGNLSTQSDFDSRVSVKPCLCRLRTLVLLPPVKQQASLVSFSLDLPQTLPVLETLVLRNLYFSDLYNMFEKSRQSFQSFHQLKRLMLRGVHLYTSDKMSEPILESIKELSHLESFEFEKSIYYYLIPFPKSIDSLTELSFTCQKLNLSSSLTKITKSNSIPFIPVYKNLKKLECFTSVELTNHFLIETLNLSRIGMTLTHLTLNHVFKINPSTLFPFLNNLKYCKLLNTSEALESNTDENWPGELIDSLSTLPHLRILKLKYLNKRFKPEALAHLSQSLPSLQRLTLRAVSHSNNPLIDHLSAAPSSSLTELNIDLFHNDRITDLLRQVHSLDKLKLRVIENKNLIRFSWSDLIKQIGLSSLSSCTLQSLDNKMILK